MDKGIKYKLDKYAKKINIAQSSNDNIKVNEYTMHQLNYMTKIIEQRGGVDIGPITQLIKNIVESTLALRQKNATLQTEIDRLLFLKQGEVPKLSTLSAEQIATIVIPAIVGNSFKDALIKKNISGIVLEEMDSIDALVTMLTGFINEHAISKMKLIIYNLWYLKQNPTNPKGRTLNLSPKGVINEELKTAVDASIDRIIHKK